MGVERATADESFALNRLSWDDRVDGHVASAFYDVEGFRRTRDCLGPIESAEIGAVAGLRIAHLQCHFGMDTISLAGRGGQATGLDFSGKAIAAAKRLAGEMGIDASFVEANVYDAPALLGAGRWDLVYTSWGTVTWLPDIQGWAEVVAQLLAPGGRLYFLDGHPGALAMEQEAAAAPIRPTYDYFHGAAPQLFESAQSYTGDGLPLTDGRTHEWIHPLGAMITALVDAGMEITAMREHDRLAWQLFPSMVRGADGMWRLPEGAPRFPLAVTIEARKPG